MKTAFTIALAVAHFDPDREILVETDALDYISAGVMSQHDDNSILNPVAFFSKKHTPIECNYKIDNKELIAIIRCFEAWRAELELMPYPIEVLSNHRNLKYFISMKLLNCWQVRYSKFLFHFNFRITY